MDNHDDIFTQNDKPPVNLPVDRPASQPQPTQQFSSPPPPEPVQQFQQQPPPTPPPSSILPRPDYAPPIPDLSSHQEPERRRGLSLFSVVIAVVAVIIILALAFFFYYFATKTFQSSIDERAPITPVKTSEPVTQPVVPDVPAVVPTKVIIFNVPAVLSAEQKSGNCWVNSIAEPYRKDAWRCMIGSVIYDPCFQTSQTGIVDCPMDLLSGSGSETIIKIIKPLPQAILPATTKDNWAWLVKTENGTFFSPYTGTRPFIDGAFATYGSKIVNGERYVLIGDLTKDVVWTAQMKVLVKEGTSWVTKSTETIKIDTVWQ